MPLTTLFRTLLLVMLFITLINIAASITLVGTLPIELQNFLATQQSDASGFEMSLAVFILIAAIAVFIGLWKFKHWARVTNLVLTAAVFVLYPYFGPVVSNVWEAIFSDISLLLQGGLIALMFTGELHQRFSASVNNSSVSS